MGTFRLDISDPIFCDPDNAKSLNFSFEDTMVGPQGYNCASLAISVGFNSWLGKFVISETGLRSLARAALATADHIRATDERRDSNK